MNAREYSKARRRAAGGLALCLGLRAWGLLAPAQVERWYARALYPAVVSFVSGVSARVPFSLAECAAALAVAVVAWRLVRALRRRAPAPPAPAVGRVGRVRAALARSAAAATLAYAVFLLAWGLNYDRLPLAQGLGLDPRPAAPAELRALCRELLDDADRLRAGLPEDGTGAMRPSGGVAGVLRRSPEGYARLAPGWPLAGAAPRAPKPLVSSALFSRLGVSGLYVPFTGEAHVNTDVPASGMPFAACHELAHQRGFAREDEASFVGYLACRAHPDDDFRYSAAFEALLESLAALQPLEPGAARAVAQAASPGVLRDWRALDAWIRRNAGPARAVSQAVNDTYLRSQGQSQGVRSYGRVVDLLLAERRLRLRSWPSSSPPASPQSRSAGGT